jgi:tRNA pseudouridine38-40 synthase
MRFKLAIEYAGTRYSGWQIQKNARTVQGELERAIRTASGKDRFELYGSGRTDAGVHALRQIAHLDISVRPPTESLRRHINDELPADIHVLSIETASHKFHARHDAIARAYLYQISRRRSAFAKPYVWWIRESLDVSAMRGAAHVFQGMKNFAAFTDDDPEEKSTSVLIERVDVEEEGDLILVRIEGSHFLWKMVRRMVGVLAAVGRAELDGSSVGELLDERSDQAGRGVAPARLSAPASGLFLERVFYAGEPRVKLSGAAFPVRTG